MFRVQADSEHGFHPLRCGDVASWDCLEGRSKSRASTDGNSSLPSLQLQVGV